MEALILEIGTGGLHRYASIEREITTIGRALDNDIILSDVPCPQVAQSVALHVLHGFKRRAHCFLFA